MDADFFSIPDIFCVNESEAEIFSGTPVRNVEEARKGSIKLLEKGCREVIITLGEQGAVYAVRGSDEVLHIPAEKVKPVDTTVSDNFKRSNRASSQAYSTLNSWHLTVCTLPLLSSSNYKDKNSGIFLLAFKNTYDEAAE